MKKILTIFAVLMSTTGMSHAADLLGDQQFDARWSWSGAVVGLEGGYGWANDRTLAGPCFNAECEANAEGGVFGGFVGYNHQIDTLVMGVEASYLYHNMEFDDGSGVTFKDSFSVAAKAGIAIDRIMAYGFIGGVYARTKADAIPLLGLGEDWTGEDWGVTYGAGLDFAVTSKIVAGVKYERREFQNFNDLPIDASSETATVRLGYKF